MNDMPDTRTINGVPVYLVAYEIEYRIEKAAADARGKDSCHYQAYRLGQKVAKNPWLTRHPGNSLERRAARKLLRETADAIQSLWENEGLTTEVIVAEAIVEQAARSTT
jgi:hypothetical protein